MNDFLRKYLFYGIFPVLLLLAFQFTGCKKKNLFSNENLSFSVDTVLFDTVFTTIGSTTKNFKFYNNSNRPVKIEQIELTGGENSPFRINVDGVSGKSFSEIDLEGNDSMYVFVEVTLQVNNQTNPMIIEDSIRFRTNGKDQYVKLAVWGQDAYFHYKEVFPVINSDTTWANDKPHVIYGYAAVDSAKTLNIPAGTQIYLHKNSLLYVYKGALNINGSLGSEVTFQGDRLESYYDDVAGQYYGIYFQEARPSIINYAIIKNGTSGIHLYSRDQSTSDYTLTLTNTIIDNCASYGVFIYSGAKVKAESCVIARNGYHSLLVLEGGDFNFNHCHLLGYSSGDGQSPTVGISNYFNDQVNGVTNVGNINEGTITNSVIYGTLDEELAIDTLNPGMAVTINLNFQFNSIKSNSQLSNSFFQNIFWNANPSFKDPSIGDFHFYSNSELIDKANNTAFPTINPFDIENHNWTGSGLAPDIGAYELF